MMEKGWLARQMANITADIDTWPAWMRREAGLSTEPDSLRALLAEKFPADWSNIDGDSDIEVRKLVLELLDRLWRWEN